MIRAVLVWAAAGAAGAQPASPGGTPAPHMGPPAGAVAVADEDGAPWRVRHGPLFVSPSGKPYRGVEGGPYPVATWFADADTNHDGKLTAGEMRADAARFFAELDVNHDGVIDGDEVARYERDILPEVHSGGAGAGGGGRPAGGSGGGRSGGGGRHGGGGGGGFGGGGGRRGGASDSGASGNAGSGGSHTAERPRGAARYGLLGLPEPVTQADTAMDRRITLAEFKDLAQRSFEALDDTGKGYVTLADLPETPAQSRSRGRR